MDLAVQDVEFHLLMMVPIPPARSEHYTHPPSPLPVIALASTCGLFLDLGVDPLHLCLLRPYVLSRRGGRRHEGHVRTVTCGYRVNLIVCGLEGGRWGMDRVCERAQGLGWCNKGVANAHQSFRYHALSSGETRTFTPRWEGIYTTNE